MPADLVELGPAGEELVALGELADDLVGRVPPTLRHGCCPISRRLGHASVAFTLDRYGHLFDQAGAPAARAIGDLLAGPAER